MFPTRRAAPLQGPECGEKTIKKLLTRQLGHALVSYSSKVNRLIDEQD